MPNLRTRKSTADPRVTLVTLADDDPHEASTPRVASTSTSSPRPTRRASQQAKSEDADSDPVLSTPATPVRESRRKRSRTSTLKEESDDDDADVKVTKKTPSKSRPSSPTKLRAKLEVAHPEPPRWRETYEIIRIQRENIVAAVDTMGCDAIAGSNGIKQEIPARDRRLASLISLMLSSQTKDPVTHEAVMNLRRNLPGGLSLESILAASDADIQACINKVGFWRRKTEYIRKSAEIIRDKFDGDVPKTIDELLILPGVGPKMGFLCLQAAWGIQVGIGVDTHVHRITNRLGWHRKPTTEAEETRVNLESWLPQELHDKINVMLVGFGQTICLPVNPRCDLCHLGQMENSPCPSKRKAFVKQAMAKKEEEEASGLLKPGELGPIADTEVEVEETEVKPIIEVKLETEVGPLNGEAAIPATNASKFFAVKQEEMSLTW
ncbi:DNA glycosylase [Cystobasidium minutum MCA 4210]|uniref:DNA glycosylase n=1 Tax=Cystobasidium minutum MCA 4210 TaxID=1397322 RepID=UPI0034CD206B|eukprot:jgi/Rhomi1/197785/gm1.5999_g